VTTVRYFAAAAEAAGTNAESFPAASLGELRRLMVAAHGGDFDRVLSRCSLLVNGTRSEAVGTPLADTDQVDVLPPFAGG
jgi:molybdopterin converting factor small subunit